MVSTLITQTIQIYSTVTLLAYFKNNSCTLKNTSGSLKLRDI